MRCMYTSLVCVLLMVFFGLWGRGVWSDVWMLVGPPSDVGGVVAGCREAVESGAVYVVKLMTTRGTGNQQ